MPPRGGSTQRRAPAAAIEVAAASLRDVLRNRDIRALGLVWTFAVAADWALLVVALVVAYDAGGAVLVGLVPLVRMLPATIVNLVLDPGRPARPERMLASAGIAGSAAALLVAGAIGLGATPVAFLAFAIAAAANAVMRPTTLMLLPAVAESPGQLIAGNTTGALGESLATFAGPLAAGIVLAAAGPLAAAGLAAAISVLTAATALGLSVPRASRPRRHEHGRSVPLVTGLRELAGRPPAGMVVASFIAQTLVRGSLTTFIAVLAIEVLGMGDEGIGTLGAALGLGGIAGALAGFGIGGRRLAPVFALSLVGWGVPIAIVGLAPMAAVACVALAVVGLSNALLDVSGFTLLQRGTTHAARGAVFAVFEVLASLGVSAGGVLGSVLVATLGIERGLLVTGLILPAVAALGWRLVRRLDLGGVVPETQASLLRGLPLFATLPLAALERVAVEMRPVRFAAGERLMTQGDPGDTFIVVETGEVEIEIDGRPHHREGPGCGIGEIALLREVPRTATVTAVVPVTGWSIDGETFVAAVTGHAPSAAAAEHVVDTRLAGSAGEG